MVSHFAASHVVLHVVVLYQEREQSGSRQIPAADERLVASMGEKDGHFRTYAVYRTRELPGLPEPKRLVHFPNWCENFW